jgi:hypothetical protein
MYIQQKKCSSHGHMDIFRNNICCYSHFILFLFCFRLSTNFYPLLSPRFKHLSYFSTITNCFLFCSLKVARKPFQGLRISRFICGATQAKSHICASIRAVRRHSVTPVTVPNTRGHIWTL